MQYTKRFIAGLATYLPYGPRLVDRRTGGTSSARYCYSVWLRHLRAAWEAGVRSIPETVGEIGPGDSLGTGIAALLSGARRYYAFDIVPYAQAQTNEAILEELVSLFLQRAPIPDHIEFPRLLPELRTYAFPHDILTHESLTESLTERRLDTIRQAVRSLSNVRDATDAAPIKYYPDWIATRVTLEEQLQFVFSQAVLEHVDDLPNTYRAVRQWLRPDGLTSHQVDLTSHEFARDWNGHWTYSQLQWRLIRGRRAYAINRMPIGAHLESLAAGGLELVSIVRREDQSRITIMDLDREFARRISPEDLVTTSAFFQARRVR
jgi:hypothetical protein